MIARATVQTSRGPVGVSARFDEHGRWVYWLVTSRGFARPRCWLRAGDFERVVEALERARAAALWASPEYVLSPGGDA